MVTKPKIIVVGIDGATWDLILPWIEEGKLPTFNKLVSNSIHGNLKSTLPPVTPAAWASFLTGKYPGKTGIYDFFYLKEKFPPKIGVSMGSTIRNESILGILSKYGYSLISVNIPMTYPPRKINGCLITGIETPEGSKFAYPDELYKKLVDDDFFPEPKISYVLGDEKEYIEKLVSNMEKREELFFYLLKNHQYDLYLLFIRETDIISHTFWKYIDKNHFLYKFGEYNDVVLKIYQKVDEFLEKIISMMNDDTMLLVMSDHGFGPEYFRIQINNWLLKKNYISLNSNIEVKIKNIINEVISPSLLWNIINQLGIKYLFKLKERQTKIGSKGLSSKLFLNFDDINWIDTKAYSFGCIGRHLPIFIKDMTDFDLDQLKKDILSINECLNDVVIKDVVEYDKLYEINTNKIMPDLIVEFETPYAGYTLSPPYFSEGNKIMIRSPKTQSGAHKLMGIILVYSNKLINKKINTVNIVDIAPTILKIFDIDPPMDMDGTVLYDIVSIIKD